MSTIYDKTDNYALNLYGDNDPADLRDGYNGSMRTIDTTMEQHLNRIESVEEQETHNEEVVKALLGDNTVDNATTAKTKWDKAAADSTTALPQSNDNKAALTALHAETVEKATSLYNDIKSIVKLDDFNPDKTGAQPSDSAFTHALAEIQANYPLKTTLLINGGTYLVQQTIHVQPFIHIICINDPTILFDAADEDSILLDFRWKIPIPSQLQAQNIISGPYGMQSWQISPLIDGGLTLYAKNPKRGVGINLGSQAESDRIFGKNLYSVARSVLKDINIGNFATGLQLGSFDMYLNKFERLNIATNDVNIKCGATTRGNNCGENIVFNNCIIAAGKYGVFMNYGTTDVYFNNCGIDFNDTFYFNNSEYANNMVCLNNSNIEGNKVIYDTIKTVSDYWRTNMVFNHNVIYNIQPNVTYFKGNPAIRLTDNIVTGNTFNVNTPYVSDDAIVSETRSTVRNGRIITSTNRDNMIAYGDNLTKFKFTDSSTHSTLKDATQDFKNIGINKTIQLTTLNANSYIVFTEEVPVKPNQQIILRTLLKTTSTNPTIHAKLIFFDREGNEVGAKTHVYFSAVQGEKGAIQASEATSQTVANAASMKIEITQYLPDGMNEWGYFYAYAE